MTTGVTTPDVPDADGVPPLQRYGVTPAADSAAQPLMTADAPSVSTPTGPQWGIFDANGTAVIVPDSVVGIDFRKEFRVSDYPIEDGGFASYNKVATPFDPRVVMTKGGADSDRSAFLAAVDAACAALTLYSVVTPEITYASVNLLDYSYRRTARNGATLLTVELRLREIRVAAAPQFTKTAQPSGADAVNGGTVAPTTPTASQGAASQRSITGNAKGATSTATDAGTATGGGIA